MSCFISLDPNVSIRSNAEGRFQQAFPEDQTREDRGESQSAQTRKVVSNLCFSDELDIFAIFIKETNPVPEFRKSLPLLEELLYSATEAILDSPRDQLVITSMMTTWKKTPVDLEDGVLVLFISRALYNSDIFEIIEKDISLINQDENSYIMDSLILYAENLQKIRQAGLYEH